MDLSGKLDSVVERHLLGDIYYVLDLKYKLVDSSLVKTTEPCYLVHDCGPCG